MNTAPAVFHQGEIAIQKRLGVDAKMDGFGRRMIRDFMPDQHRDFYQQLPLLFTGFEDRSGDVWASVLTGAPGFIDTPNAKTMEIASAPLEGDPLQAEMAYQKTLAQPALRLGLLGIELHSRRRNRLSAELAHVSSAGLELNVLQAFGNCPQYIQTRELIQVPSGQYKPSAPVVLTDLNDELSQFIASSDTFFVASSSQHSAASSTEGAEHGADVSHRGGQPGFVKVEGNTLTIPDYLGNNHFNTLGNLMVNPKAGLLFINFETGDILTLTGTTEVLFDDDEQRHFTGAERLWKFRVTRGYLLKGALPYRWQFDSYSPTSLMTGTWQDAQQRAEESQQKSRWKTYRVDKVEKESSLITSFHLSPQSGPIPDFNPGQFLNLRVTIDGEVFTRQYSVSSAPADKFLRISVKRDSAVDGHKGKVSHYLHGNIDVGDELSLSQPNGQFWLDASSVRPAVLLSAGVGITPMMSMLRHVLHEGVRTRHLRPVIMINSVRNETDIPFAEEIHSLVNAAHPTVRAHWLVSQPERESSLDPASMMTGRLQKQHLQHLLQIDDYEFFLCGPASYMQSTYNLLIDLGVVDSRIHAEAFGPATLVRIKQTVEPVSKQAEPANEAVVKFEKSGIEQAWSDSEANLLDFAEAHGLKPEFGCRNGQCGMCKVKVLEGSVVHAEQATSPIADNEALLCCSKPAKQAGEEIPIIRIDA